MFLDEKSSQECPVNVGVPQGCILDPTLFLLYINDLPDNDICNIAIYADNATLYFKFDETFDVWQQLELNLNLILIFETLSTGAGSGLLISMLEKLSLFRL